MPAMKNLYPIAALAGGVLWIVLHLFLAGAWDRGSAFPTYEFLNGLRPLPLTLFGLALYGLYRIVNTGRKAYFVSLAGFFLLAAGAAIEFWIGGGVRDGDVDTLSLVGWLTYLVGYLVLSIGLIVFGVAVYRARAWGTNSVMPLITGTVWALWFPFIMFGNVMSGAYADIVQYIFGLLWIVTGLLMVKQSAPRVAVGGN